jgi:hypothetical protein
VFVCESTFVCVCVRVVRVVGSLSLSLSLSLCLRECKLFGRRERGGDRARDGRKEKTDIRFKHSEARMMMMVKGLLTRCLCGRWMPS